MIDEDYIQRASRRENVTCNGPRLSRRDDVTYNGSPPRSISFSLPRTAVFNVFFLGLLSALFFERIALAEV